MAWSERGGTNVVTLRLPEAAQGQEEAFAFLGNDAAAADQRPKILVVDLGQGGAQVGVAETLASNFP